MILSVALTPRREGRRISLPLDADESERRLMLSGGLFAWFRDRGSHQADAGLLPPEAQR